MIAGHNEDYYHGQSKTFTCNDGSFEIKRHYCKKKQDTTKLEVQETTFFTLTARTASQAVEKNTTSERQK